MRHRFRLTIIRHWFNRAGERALMPKKSIRYLCWIATVARGTVMYSVSARTARLFLALIFPIALGGAADDLNGPPSPSPQLDLNPPKMMTAGDTDLIAATSVNAATIYSLSEDSRCSGPFRDSAFVCLISINVGRKVGRRS
jgi:hypothetical protein